MARIHEPEELMYDDPTGYYRDVRDRYAGRDSGEVAGEVLAEGCPPGDLVAGLLVTAFCKAIAGGVADEGLRRRLVGDALDGAAEHLGDHFLGEPGDVLHHAMETAYMARCIRHGRVPFECPEFETIVAGLARSPEEWEADDSHFPLEG